MAELAKEKTLVPVQKIMIQNHGAVYALKVMAAQIVMHVTAGATMALAILPRLQKKCANAISHI